MAVQKVLQKGSGAEVEWSEVCHNRYKVYVSVIKLNNID